MMEKPPELRIADRAKAIYELDSTYDRDTVEVLLGSLENDLDELKRRYGGADGELDDEVMEDVDDVE